MGCISKLFFYFLVFKDFFIKRLWELNNYLKSKIYEKQVKPMTTPEILEELRKYGWTKNNLSRNTRKDLENKLLFSMMPNAIIDISDDD